MVNIPKIEYNIATLREHCLADMNYFVEKYDGEIYVSVKDERDMFAFFDRGAKILAVAHVDIHPSVMKHRHFGYTRFDPPIDGGVTDRIFSTALDDHLGLYIIFDILPKLGITVDVLITDQEEVGRSTADLFSTNVVGIDRDYNWIVEFDRHGEDWVAYQYQDSEWEKTAESAGFTTGWGSFTDICQLEHLGCKAMNIAVGYYNEHTVGCFADLNVTTVQLERFYTFWDMYKDTHFPHVYGSGKNYMSRYYDQWSYYEGGGNKPKTNDNFFPTGNGGTGGNGTTAGDIATDVRIYTDIASCLLCGKTKSEHKDLPFYLTPDNKIYCEDCKRKLTALREAASCDLCGRSKADNPNETFYVLPKNNQVVCRACRWKDTYTKCIVCKKKILYLDAEFDFDRSEPYCRDCMKTIYEEEWAEATSHVVSYTDQDNRWQVASDSITSTNDEITEECFVCGRSRPWVGNNRLFWVKEIDDWACQECLTMIGDEDLG